MSRSSKDDLRRFRVIPGGRASPPKRPIDIEEAERLGDAMEALSEALDRLNKVIHYILDERYRDGGP